MTDFQYTTLLMFMSLILFNVASSVFEKVLYALGFFMFVIAAIIIIFFIR